MTESDPDFYDASLRVSGLHPTHHWVYWAGGDCFDGSHAFIMCSNCEIGPFKRQLCYHDLPFRASGLPKYLESKNIEIEPLALEPCPFGRVDD